LVIIIDLQTFTPPLAQTMGCLNSVPAAEELVFGKENEEVIICVPHILSFVPWLLHALK
jgi:hypothetical protein